MRRIAVAGYLGNQLFQWAFGHSFHNINSTQFAMQEMNLPTNGWKCQLNFLMNSCEHFKIKQPRKSDFYRDKIVGKTEQMLKSVAKDNSLALWAENISKVRSESNLKSNEAEKSRNFLYYGYFQNVNYFKTKVPELTNEINKAVIIKKDSLQNSNFELNRVMRIIENIDFMLVHVRRGDFVHPQNSGFGLLSTKYYVANKKNMPIVIATDDIEGSKDIIRELSPVCVIDPKAIDAVTTLYFFTQATVVLSSNSTYSYWGALLALNLGKRVIIPNSFRPLAEDLEHFWIEGMNVAQADFIRT